MIETNLNKILKSNKKNMFIATLKIETKIIIQFFLKTSTSEMLNNFIKIAHDNNIIIKEIVDFAQKAKIETKIDTKIFVLGSRSSKTDFFRIILIASYLKTLLYLTKHLVY